MKEIVVLENGTYLLDEYVAKDIALFEQKMKELKFQYDKYKAAIKEEMEAKGIISIKDEVNGISINYIAEQTELEKFDKDKFREENPELYDNYVTLDGKKSAYITIRVK